MPDKTKHLNQTRHNLALLDEPPLKAPSAKYSDWFVTICFYAAMHLIDHRLAELVGGIPGDPVDHMHRQNMIDRVLEPKYPGLSAQYVALKIMSIKARYECLDINGIRTNHAIALFNNIARIMGVQP